jgi:hypothetical protein
MEVKHPHIRLPLAVALLLRCVGHLHVAVVWTACSNLGFLAGIGRGGCIVLWLFLGLSAGSKLGN